jgi:hypothetical protein
MVKYEGTKVPHGTSRHMILIKMLALFYSITKMKNLVNPKHNEACT